MNKKLTHLLQHRDQLIQQAAMERHVLSIHCAPWKKPLTWLDKGLALLHSTAPYRAILVGALTALTTYRLSYGKKIFSSGKIAFKIIKKLFN